jgi:hypothetical protein
MLKTDFQSIWETNFPNCPPINHLFKHRLADRWLRIHSLPEAKRYADTPKEWAELLHRQHVVLEDFFAQNEPVFIYAITGFYSNEEQDLETQLQDQNDALKTFDFNPLEPIDLYIHSSDWYDEGVIFTPYYAKEKFKSNKFDAILRAIADDEIRVFFMDTNAQFIFAPYDGGVDLIYKDVETRNFYEKKYQEWLP